MQRFLAYLNVINYNLDLSIRDSNDNVVLLQITSKVVDFIVDGNLSFNIAQLPSLQTLLETVSGRKVIIPSRRKFMNTLDEKFKMMKDSLKTRLQKQQYICITCDVWSSRGQSYLGVTCHFLNEAFQRESFVLAFKRLYYRQTYAELAAELDKIFNDYEIRIEQITHIVTDGGSAFCKMFKEFGNAADTVVQMASDNEEDDGSDAPPLQVRQVSNITY